MVPVASGQLGSVARLTVPRDRGPIEARGRPRTKRRGGTNRAGEPSLFGDPHLDGIVAVDVRDAICVKQ